MQANTATVLELLSILTLPSSSEREQDMARVNYNVQYLVPKLFVNYDRSSPPNSLVEVGSFFLVDHLEEMTWNDNRLIWEPKDFGNLNSLSFGAFDLARFWTPDFAIKGTTLSSRPLIQFHNTEFTLMSSGDIVAEVGVSAKAACRIDLTLYPSDNLTCHIMLYVPVYNTAHPTPSFLKRDASLFSSHNMTSTAGFELENLVATNFFVHSQGVVLDEKDIQNNPALVNSGVRFQFHLRRDSIIYYANVAIPQFCCAIMTLLAGTSTMPNSQRFVLLWLMACLILQIFFNIHMIEYLPKSVERPRCGKNFGFFLQVLVNISIFLIIQTVFLIVYRSNIWTKHSKVILPYSSQFKSAIEYLLILEIFLLFLMIF